MQFNHTLVFESHELLIYTLDQHLSHHARGLTQQHPRAHFDLISVSYGQMLESCHCKQWGIGSVVVHVRCADRRPQAVASASSRVSSSGSLHALAKFLGILQCALNAVVLDGRSCCLWLEHVPLDPLDLLAGKRSTQQAHARQLDELHHNMQTTILAIM